MKLLSIVAAKGRRICPLLSTKTIRPVASMPAHLNAFGWPRSTRTSVVVGVCEFFRLLNFDHLITVLSDSPNVLIFYHLIGICGSAKEIGHGG